MPDVYHFPRRAPDDREYQKTRVRERASWESVGKTIERWTEDTGDAKPAPDSPVEICVSTTTQFLATTDPGTPPRS